MVLSENRAKFSIFLHHGGKRQKWQYFEFKTMVLFKIIQIVL